MAHDVFISYSAHDKPAADAVCAKLESRGIRCWIAPRDIRPGMSWGGAIVEAIDGARVMMLLFSSHANDSPQIKREVERAVHKEIIVVPVRVEDVKPTGDFEYFLGTPHWLDAITAPFEQHLEHIADSAGFWLERGGSGPPSAAPRPPAPASEEPRAAASHAAIAGAGTRPKWIAPSIAALMIGLVGIAAYFGVRYRADQQELARRRAPEQSAAPAATTQAQKGPEENTKQTQKEGAVSEPPAGAGKALDAEAKRRLEAADAQVDRILGAIRLGTPPEAAGTPDPASVDAIRTAAEAGGREQQRRLGGLYVHGLGVPQDDAQAFSWMGKSAAQNEPMAEFILGTMYQHGRGVEQDYGKAVGWFRKSAAQGNAFGENNLGVMYHNGWGVPLDYDQAIGWYRKAAEQGMPEGEANLGFMYQKGWGVPQDYGQALFWYRKAAERGNPKAEHGLGVMYQHGWGVPRDRDEAAKWYRKAAAHGNPRAKRALNRFQAAP